MIFQFNLKSIQPKFITRLQILRKIILYVFANSYDENSEKKEELKKYLQKCLERKKLKRMKDVEYDITEGKIKKIPGLFFNKKTKKFIIKQQEKKKSLKKKKGSRRKKSDKKKKGEKRKKRNNKTNKIDKHLKEKQYLL